MKKATRWWIILLLTAALFAGMALVPAEKSDEKSEKSGEPDIWGWNGQILSQPDEVIRFHVIAASDEAGAQDLKLKVRDAVLDYLEPKIKGIQDRDEAARVIERHLDQIRSVAERTIAAEGYAEPVRVCWGVSLFPVKAYGPLIFPAGSYQALKIVIGEGGGKNWWCVVFPPLCYVDLTRSAQVLSGEDDKHTSVQHESCRLTTKAGEVVNKTKAHSLLSWIWTRRS